MMESLSIKQCVRLSSTIAKDILRQCNAKAGTHYELDDDCRFTPHAYEDTYEQKWRKFLSCFYGDIQVEALSIPPIAPPSPPQLTVTSLTVASDAELNDEVNDELYDELDEADRSSNAPDLSDEEADGTEDVPSFLEEFGFATHERSAPYEMGEKEQKRVFLRLAKLRPST